MNELKEKYKLKIETEKSEFIKKVNSVFKEKANKKLENIKKNYFNILKI